jgi:hypothetical protein
MSNAAVSTHQAPTQPPPAATAEPVTIPAPPVATPATKSACECCDRGEDDGDFWTLGTETYCDEHATSCTGCGDPVPLSATMMCDLCRPRFEWAKDSDDVWGWFRREKVNHFNACSSDIAVHVRTVRIQTPDGEVVVRRDQLERELKAARKDETVEMMNAGWNAYGGHGYWNKGRTGPSTTRTDALCRVRRAG